MNNDELKYFKKAPVEAMKVPPNSIEELTKQTKAPMEPEVGEYHIQLSITESDLSKQTLDTIKTVVDGEVYLIKIPDIQ